jgi:hypothetical protein
LSGISKENAPDPRGAKAIYILGLVEPAGVNSNKSLGAQVVVSIVPSIPPVPDSLQGGYFEEETHLTAGF